MMNHLGDRSNFSDASRVHDGDTVGGFGDDTHVVCDQHHRGAVFATEFFQKRNNLRLNGNIQCGGRLIGNDEFRLRRKRQRNHHALAHAAGKLMRVGVNAFFSSRNADFKQ